MSSSIRALLVAIVLLALLATWVGPVLVPDGFVDFEYARSLAEGHGFAGPRGTAVEGYSGLLWVLLCAGMHAAGMNVPASAPYVSLLFAVVVMFLLAFRRTGTSAMDRALPLAALATAAPFVVASVSVTDTTLFAALLVAGALALDAAERRPTTGRLVVLTAVMVLTLLCRPEALLAVAVAVTMMLRTSDERARGRLRAVALATVVAALAFHAWRTVFFGSIVPDSLRVSFGLNSALVRLLPPYDMEPYGVYYAAAAAASWFAWTRSPRRAGDRYGLVAAGLLGIFYFFVEDPTPTQLHHATLLAPAVLPWPFLVASLRAAPRNAPRRARAMALTVGALALLAVGTVADQRLTVARLTTSYDLALRPLGEWIRDYQPRARIATDAPGVVTYYADGTAVDLRPRLPRERPDPVAAVLTTNPHFVIIGADGIFDRQVPPRFQRLLGAMTANYRLLAALRTAWVRDRTLLVYIRRDFPPLTGTRKSSFPEGVGSVLLLNP